MRHYQFPSEQAFLQEERHVDREDGKARGYIGILAAVFATELELEAPIVTNCLFLIFDRDFYYSPLSNAFRLRPVNKDCSEHKARPFNTKIFEEEVTVVEKEFKEWLLKKHHELTEPC